MATTDKTGIQASITAGIRTGASDTTAAELRAILNEILDSYANVIDGGNVYQNPVGYNYLPTVLGASNFINRDYADARYLVGLATVLNNGNSTDNLDIISQSGVSTLQVKDIIAALQYGDGFTNSGLFMDNGGVLLISDVASEYNSPSHLFTTINDNVSMTLRSPSGFYYPTLTFQNNGGTTLGSITGYGGALYIGGVGGTPLIVSGSIVAFPLITANKLLYNNGSQNLAEVTIGARLSFSAGVLSEVTRVTSITSSATPTPNADTDDLFKVTALAAAALLTNPTGTPSSGQSLLVRIKDNGTARALTFDTLYRFSSDQPAPTTTVINKTIYLGFVYNSTDTKWDCLGWITNI